MIKVSIIIINYNYSKYLAESIDSALNQTYANVEVIVVDDGSKDNSSDIIKSYGDDIEAVFQENRGMIEASNAGFNLATGNIILFLDADDYLYEDAAEKVISSWEDGTSKVHFRLQKINAKGEHIGTNPANKYLLSSGDVSKLILRTGTYVTPPTSGNAYSKKVLDNIFPIKIDKIGRNDSYFDRIPTDAYLKFRIPFYGEIKSIQDTCGVYRIHGENQGASKSPYKNKYKRQRILKQSLINTEFIKKQCIDKEISHNKDILFYDSSLLKLRILSYSKDSDLHLWPDDNKRKLFKLTLLSFNNSDQYRNHKKIFDMIYMITMIAFIKKRSS